MAPPIELVAEGCGWGWHRHHWQDRWGNWHWGRCVPDEGRPYGGWGVGWYDPPHIGAQLRHRGAGLSIAGKLRAEFPGRLGFVKGSSSPGHRSQRGSPDRPLANTRRLGPDCKVTVPAVPTVLTSVETSPITVRAPPSVGALYTPIGTSPTVGASPAPAVMVRRAMRRNPSASPSAPVTRHGVPAPTTAAPYLDDARRWTCPDRFHIGPNRNRIRRHWGHQNKHSSQGQPENTHL